MMDFLPKKQKKVMKMTKNMKTLEIDKFKRILCNSNDYKTINYLLESFVDVRDESDMILFLNVNHLVLYIHSIFMFGFWVSFVTSTYILISEPLLDITFFLIIPVTITLYVFNKVAKQVLLKKLIKKLKIELNDDR